MVFITNFFFKLLLFLLFSINIVYLFWFDEELILFIAGTFVLFSLGQILAGLTSQIFEKRAVEIFYLFYDLLTIILVLLTVLKRIGLWGIQLVQDLYSLRNYRHVWFSGYQLYKYLYSAVFDLFFLSLFESLISTEIRNIDKFLTIVGGNRMVLELRALPMPWKLYIFGIFFSLAESLKVFKVSKQFYKNYFVFLQFCTPRQRAEINQLSVQPLYTLRYSALSGPAIVSKTLFDYFLVITLI